MGSTAEAAALCNAMLLTCSGTSLTDQRIYFSLSLAISVLSGKEGSNKIIIAHDITEPDQLEQQEQVGSSDNQLLAVCYFFQPLTQTNK